MAAPHVQHVMGHVRAGHVVGNHFHTNRAVCSWSLVDIRARNQRGGSDGV